MPSRALRAWRDERRPRIADLAGVHEAIRLPGPGRKWNTEQLNRALVLAIAAEFQGFARDLHDDAIREVVRHTAADNLALAEVVQLRLEHGRMLDRGNAHPGALGSDFGRLGLDLWPALEAADPRSRRRNVHLAALNDARNAIAHALGPQLARMRLRGYPVTLRTVHRWRDTVDALAVTMDAVTSAHLADLFSVDRPW